MYRCKDSGGRTHIYSSPWPYSRCHILCKLPSNGINSGVGQLPLCDLLHPVYQVLVAGGYHLIRPEHAYHHVCNIHFILTRKLPLNGPSIRE